MNLSVSSRRRLFTFRTELTAEFSDLPERSIRELGAAAGELLREDLPTVREEPLRFLDEAILIDMRGRPELTAGSEGSEEPLLVLEGTMPKIDDPEDRRSFRLSLTTQFLDFQGRAIRYKVRVRASSGLELGEHTLRSLCEDAVLTFDRLFLFFDYFRSRELNFLNLRMPEVKERLSLEAGDRWILKMEDSNFSEGFSERFQRKLKIFEWMFGAPFAAQLNEQLARKK